MYFCQTNIHVVVYTCMCGFLTRIWQPTRRQTPGIEHLFYYQECNYLINGVFYNLTLSTRDLRFGLMSKIHDTCRARACFSVHYRLYCGDCICVSRQTTGKSSETTEKSGALAPELSHGHGFWLGRWKTTAWSIFSVLVSDDEAASSIDSYQYQLMLIDTHGIVACVNNRWSIG